MEIEKNMVEEIYAKLNYSAKWEKIEILELIYSVSHNIDETNFETKIL